MATTAARARSGRSSTARGGAAAQGHPLINAKNVSQDDRRLLERYGDRLSKTTLRARCIHSPDEHEDRAGQTRATRSGDVVRTWARSRDGEPATVEMSRSKDDGRPHVLRINLPGRGGRSLTPVRWDDWVRPFHERDLAFLFQERLRDGRDSNSLRLDNPEREDV